MDKSRFNKELLILAASEWRDEKGLTWLEHAPKITLLRVREVCSLEWAWEVKVPELDTSVRKAKPGEVVEIPVPQPTAKMNNTACKNARSRAADKWAKDRKSVG